MQEIPNSHLAANRRNTFVEGLSLLSSCKLITFDVPPRFFPCTTATLPAHPDDLVVEVSNPLVNYKKAEKEEDSAAKMQRLAEEMRFRIREAMAQRGGSEAFLHWLRNNGGKSA